MTNPRKQLLTPEEVAALFSVSTKTVSRWAKRGILPGLKTPGGHWRFYAADVERMRNG